MERVKEVSYKSDIHTALDSFQHHQEKAVEQVKTKEEQVAENREKRLKEMRDKLKAQQDRVEAVKRKKRLAQLNADQDQQITPLADDKTAESAFGQTKSRITEDTPITSSKANYSYLDYITQ